MSNFTGLTVGRIVHFFTKDVTKHSNGQGEGPYPAIVLKAYVEGETGDLMVCTVTGDFVAGSVSEQSVAEKGGHSQWWTWPPRV